MMEQRPLGIVVFVIGAIGALVSALADPLGIGTEDVFGWLQITGVILGAAVALIGLALAAEWIPYPGPKRAVTASNAGQNATIVEDREPRDRPS
jgi:hypothetical protein